VQPELAENLRQ